jgi:uncharacterized protein RhaS with RHS repeats
MYYRARYYDPRVGRFTTKDPIGFAGGDTNLYAYVMNDPVNLVDPMGLYGSQTHFYVARDAAVGAGLPREIAEIVGLASKGVDTLHDPEKLKNRGYHFSTYEEAMVRVRSASTPFELGEAVHTLMDSYSHEGLNYLTAGQVHLWQSHLLDAWDPNSERDRLMYGSVRAAIEAWAKDQRGCSR